MPIHIRIAFGFALTILLLSTPALAQRLLYSGGEFDFEAGFTVHTPSIFDDKPWDEVGNGWGYWGQPAVFMPPEDRFGHPAFNRNQFSPNVSSGQYSQEITLTSANGDGIIWKTFNVPVGHTIRCTFDAITTPSEDMLQLRHAIGQGAPIAFFDENVTDPFALDLDWEQWDINETNNHFGANSVSIEAATSQLTYYFWVRHEYATSSGATLVCDNLRVYDTSSTPAPTAQPTATPTPRPPATMQVR